MQRIMRCVLVVALAALPLAAQQSLPQIAQAQQVLVLADSAGAQTYAKSLYDEAALKIRYAQDNMASRNDAIRQQAMLNAQEALFAARAALAKARWLSTNAAVTRSKVASPNGNCGTWKSRALPRRCQCTRDPGEVIEPGVQWRTDRCRLKSESLCRHAES